MGTPNDLLDPTRYTMVPHIAVVDECTLPIPSKEVEGEFEYFTIDAAFLDKVVFNGNRREAETGDLTPLVIGRHTKKGAAETAQPEIVGWARNWSRGQLFNTTRQAAYADLWIKNEDVERVKKFPRRSAEIWRGRAEIDPISLLGATTPERDLGLLPIALSRGETCTGRFCSARRHDDQEISATFYCDRGFDMPTPTDDRKGDEGTQNATPNQADIAQTLNKLVAAVSDLQATVSKLVSGGTGGGGEEVPGGGAAGAPGAGGEPGEEMSDEEIEKLIAELEGQGGAAGAAGTGEGQGAAGAAPGAGQPPRKTDEPAQAMGYPGGSNTQVPTEQPAKASRHTDPEVARLQDELEAIKLERAREQITTKINDLEKAGVIFEDKDAEVRDLLALPADMRPTMLSRIEKSYQRQSPGNGRTLASVINAASNVVGTITKDQQDEVVRLAREDAVSYEVAFKKKFGRYPWEAVKV